MSQHFLLSPKARTLNLMEVASLSEEEAYNKFKLIRFAETGGEPYCPHKDCGCADISEIKSRRIFRCRGCWRQFSVTSKTIFASRKLDYKRILFGIALFVMGVKGLAACQLSRELQVQYKTAFVMLHKIREAIGVEQDCKNLTGEIEVDGAWYGNHIRPPNFKPKPRPRGVAKKENDAKKKLKGYEKCMVVIRQVYPTQKTVPLVFDSEWFCEEGVRKRIHPSAIVYTDELGVYRNFGYYFKDHRIITHSVGYCTPESCTNWVESFHSRVRRSERGVYHRIADEYLLYYGQEMAWREDNRHCGTAELFNKVLHAVTHHKVSRLWKGYWQRSQSPAWQPRPRLHPMFTRRRGTWKDQYTGI